VVFGWKMSHETLKVASEAVGNKLFFYRKSVRAVIELYDKILLRQVATWDSSVGLL
jgi:hypothetical protein